MTNIISKLLLGFLMLVVFSSAYCQNTKATTIIIVRHAEKDKGNDPALTKEGMQRAERLSSLFHGIKPEVIYTTPYLRTTQTITPWAKELGVEIQKYNPNKLSAFSDELRNMEGKTILIAGHSNTNPALVNLLLKEEKYQQLNDADYETIFIVTIEGNDAKAKILNRKE